MEKIKRIKGYIISILIAIICSTLATMIIHHYSSYDGDYSYGIWRDRIELHYHGAKDALVSEVENYIDSVAPESCLNGLKVVELCEEYNMDLKFVLAQGQLESHFGTAGIAASTNSVWNVHSFDNKSAEQIKREGKGYSHPDNSIEPYIKLLKNRYMVNGKTEKDLFVKFVDADNKRYAQNPNYEDSLLVIYERIGKDTDIDEMIKNYKKYKIICGK